MITEDQALAIANHELRNEVKAGGLPTLYGYSDHWVATCTYRDDGRPDGFTPARIRISAVDGSVRR